MGCFLIRGWCLCRELLKLPSGPLSGLGQGHQLLVLTPENRHARLCPLELLSGPVELAAMGRGQPASCCLSVLRCDSGPKEFVSLATDQGGVVSLSLQIMQNRVVQQPS